jgi:tRNA(Ile)-lysidine synthase
MRLRFPERALRYVREHGLMKPGDRVGVACSGGPDSVALLRLLLELRGELGVSILVMHLNHQIRETSATDRAFVGELARAHGVTLMDTEFDVPAFAREQRTSLEDTGRIARLAFFDKTLREGVVERVATGHTRDDQAETVLMKLLRGSAADGLAGLYPSLERRPGWVIRPMLELRRVDILEYLRELEQPWREDESNQDVTFLRNRVRHRLVPMLERDFNPSVVENLAQTAEIFRDESDFWQTFVRVTLPELWRRADVGGSLDVSRFAQYPRAVQRQLVRAIAAELGIGVEFQHIERVLRLAAPGMAGKLVPLRKGWKVRRGSNSLHWSREDAEDPPTQPFEYALAIPGNMRVPETGSAFSTAVGGKTLQADGRPQGDDPSALIDRAVVNGGLVVRNWRPGDRFYPQHSGGPKKIKELLTMRKITGRERELWPVVAAGERIVWLRGWGIAADAVAAAGSEGVRIEEVVSEE